MESQGCRPEFHARSKKNLIDREGWNLVIASDSSDMITDIGTKACTKEEFERLLLPMKGHEAWKITKPRHTMTFT